jgi:hypothetical protein
VVEDGVKSIKPARSPEEAAYSPSGVLYLTEFVWDTRAYKKNRTVCFPGAPAGWLECKTWTWSRRRWRKPSSSIRTSGQLPAAAKITGCDDDDDDDDDDECYARRREDNLIS